MLRLIALVVCIPLLAAPFPAFAEKVDFVKLENELWQAAKDVNMEKVKSLVAAGYQEIDETGIRQLQAGLKDTKTEKMSNFTLSDFKVTRNGPTVVVTYYAAVSEILAGKRIQKQKAPRASIWIKTDKGWKTIFHANCNPVKQ